MDELELVELRRRRKFAELILSLENAKATIRYLTQHPEIVVLADLEAIDQLVASVKETRWRLQST
jgi:hypothetical protein